MSSARFITLFSEPPPPSRGSLSILASFLAHGLMVVMLFLWLMQRVPQINNTLLAKRTTVHLLNLDKPEPARPRDNPELNFSPLQSAANKLHTSLRSVGTHSTPVHAAPTLPVVQATQQAIVQPSEAMLPQTKPLPNIVQASPDQLNPVHITAQPPQAVTAAVQPTLTPPNHEPVPADIKISSTDFPSAMPMLPPTRTVAVRQPNQTTNPDATQAQASTAVPTAPSTPANVVTLSSLHMPEAGIALPHANATTPAAESTTTAPGTASNASASGASGSGAGTGTSSMSAAQGQGNQSVASIGPTTAGTGTADHITLPKNGQFGVVVVGASLDDEYPEATGLWGGRMPYTVYVHVGLAKSWILQYSLPPAANSAAVGTVGNVAAPWPYDIKRPNLAAGDINADALMVHGFINKDGHFETLAVVSPQQFAQEKFVLDALRQWQFRPAEENGQDTNVEVLLIIPDMVD